MGTKKLLSVLLVIVIGVSLIPIVGDMVDTADNVNTTETFTATQDNLTSEDFTVSNTIVEINDVSVNGIQLEEAGYSFTGNTVTLVADASNIDDEVAIAYTYETDLGTAVDSMLGLLPILFVVMIVGGAVGYVKFR